MYVCEMQVFSHGPEVVVLAAAAGAVFCWRCGKRRRQTQERKERQKTSRLSFVSLSPCVSLLHTNTHTNALAIQYVVTSWWCNFSVFFCPKKFLIVSYLRGITKHTHIRARVVFAQKSMHQYFRSTRASVSVIKNYCSVRQNDLLPSAVFSVLYVYLLFPHSGSVHFPCKLMLFYQIFDVVFSKQLNPFKEPRLRMFFYGSYLIID